MRCCQSCSRPSISCMGCDRPSVLCAAIWEKDSSGARSQNRKLRFWCCCHYPQEPWREKSGPPSARRLRRGLRTPLTGPSWVPRASSATLMSHSWPAPQARRTASPLLNSADALGRQREILRGSPPKRTAGVRAWTRSSGALLRVLGKSTKVILKESRGHLSPAHRLRLTLQWMWRPLSRVRLLVTSWTIQPMEFSRPEHWSGQPVISPVHLPNPGIEPGSPALQADSLPAEPQKNLSGRLTLQWHWKINNPISA